MKDDHIVQMFRSIMKSTDPLDIFDFFVDFRLRDIIWTELYGTVKDQR